MTTYNKKVAADLCQQLIDVVTRIAAAVEEGEEKSQLVDLTCERLGKAISDLQTTIRL